MSATILHYPAHARLVRAIRDQMNRGALTRMEAVDRLIRAGMTNQEAMEATQ